MFVKDDLRLLTAGYCEEGRQTKNCEKSYDVGKICLRIKHIFECPTKSNG